MLAKVSPFDRSCFRRHEMSGDDFEFERFLVVSQLVVIRGERDPSLSDGRIDSNDFGEEFDRFVVLSKSVKRASFPKDAFDFWRGIQIRNSSTTLSMVHQYVPWEGKGEIAPFA